MEKVDRWVIEQIAEPCAWWMERRLGIEAMQAARVLLAVFVAGGIAQAWQDGKVTGWVLAAFCVMNFPLRMWMMYRTETAARRGANPEKHGVLDGFFRVFLLWMNATGMVYELATWSWSISPLSVGNRAFLLHAYLSACDRPPPIVEVDRRLAPAGAAS